MERKLILLGLLNIRYKELVNKDGYYLWTARSGVKRLWNWKNHKNIEEEEYLPYTEKEASKQLRYMIKEVGL